MNSDQSMYVIWSWHHSQWWAPNRQGYVDYLPSAGVYSAFEAGDIHTASGLPGRNTAVHEQVANNHFRDMKAAQVEEILDSWRRL